METLTLERDVFITWCSVGQHLTLTSHSQIAAFLLNFYLTREQPEECACSRCGTAFSKCCPNCSLLVQSKREDRQTFQDQQVADHAQEQNVDVEESREDDEYCIETESSDLEDNTDCTLDQRTINPKLEAAEQSAVQTEGWQSCDSLHSPTADSSICLPQTNQVDGAEEEYLVEEIPLQWEQEGLMTGQDFDGVYVVDPSLALAQKEPCVAFADKRLQEMLGGETDACPLMEAKRTVFEQEAEIADHQPYMGVQESNLNQTCIEPNQEDFEPNLLPMQPQINCNLNNSNDTSSLAEVVCKYKDDVGGDTQITESSHIVSETMQVDIDKKPGRNRAQASTLCDICGKKFKTLSSLEKHRPMHSISRYECKVCKKSFKTKGSWTTHQAMHYSGADAQRVNGRLYCCDICEKRYSSASRLHDHMLTHSGLESGHHRCDICRKIFPYQILLEHHKITHNTKAVECPVCNKIFPSDSRMKQHLKASHTEESENLSCPVCSKTYSSVVSLKMHQQMHGPGFTCPECGKVVQTKSGFKNHLKIHNSPNGYTCHVCNKQFTWQGSLNTHILLVHTQENSYVCEECGKGFKLKRALRRHLLTHTDKHNYFCDVCSMGFKSTTGMYAHKKQMHMDHSLLVSYSCDQCDYSTLFKHVLNSHKKIHSAERPYVCDVCNKDFYRPYHLKKHKLVHSSGKALTSRCKNKTTSIFSCDKCQEEFKTDFELCTHSLIHEVVLQYDT